jgi:hypothetical protein
MYRVDTVDYTGEVTESQQFDDAGALILYLYAQVEGLPCDEHPHKLVVTAPGVFTFRKAGFDAADPETWPDA